MKQHITVAQLKEINEHTIYKIVCYNFNSFWTTEPDYKWLSEQFNIGNLLELLNKRRNIDSDIELVISTTGYTYLGVVYDNYNNKKWFDGKELCDVLWNAVKSMVLNIEQ